MAKEFSDIAKVISVSPNQIEIEIFDPDSYESLTPKILIGSYIKISDDHKLALIAIVQSFRIKDIVTQDQTEESKRPRFIIDCQQVGSFSEGKFRRGGQQIAIPPTKVEQATQSDLESIYQGIKDEKRFSFGTLSQNDKIQVIVDGDKFFGKHIGVVGSTGSGKSCTVAKILQEGINSSADQKKRGILNNSHIIIFDLHGEYKSAFPKANIISIDNLKLPYWLMNSEELEELFIESQEQNSHNQISQFKAAVIKNKEKHNSSLKVDYDTPAYFSLKEVHQYIKNQNLATVNYSTHKLEIIDRDESVADEYILFEENISFVETKAKTVKTGAFFGEFDRFISRIEGKLNDERLEFLLKPRKKDKSEYTSSDLLEIIEQFIGYSADKSNITIIDLGGIPFEVLSIVVSLITRLIFTFSFYLKKNKLNKDEIPFLLVYEEAHNYIPQNDTAKYKTVKKSIERIAKEGRKYGISLMIVSQRPSEISDTIFSQCNNFVAMRLTNPTDQQYIKRLLPDSISAITDSLPVLEKQEAIIIGDSIQIPSIIEVDDISEKPNSQDINFQTEWKKDWVEGQFDNLVKDWTKTKKGNA